MHRFRRCSDCEALPERPHAEWCSVWETMQGPHQPWTEAVYDPATKTSYRRLPPQWAHLAGTEYDPQAKTIVREEAA